MIMICKMLKKKSLRLKNKSTIILLLWKPNMNKSSKYKMEVGFHNVYNLLIVICYYILDLTLTIYIGKL